MLRFHSWILAAALAVGLTFATLGAALSHGGRTVGEYEFVVGFLAEPPYAAEPNGFSVRVTRLAAGPGDMDHADDHRAEGTTAGADVHGALVNEVMAAGTSFRFEFDTALAGESIQFHVHPGDFHLTVAVDAGAPAVTGLEFGFSEAAPKPVVTTVGPGTTVLFVNQGSATVVLMSGLADEPAVTGAVPVTGLERQLQVEVKHVASGERRVLALEAVAGNAGAYLGRFTPNAGAYEFRLFGAIEGTPINETFRSGAGGLDPVRPPRGSIQDAAGGPASPDQAPRWGVIGAVAAGVGGAVTLGILSLYLMGRKRPRPA